MNYIEIVLKIFSQKFFDFLIWPFLLHEKLLTLFVTWKTIDAISDKVQYKY